MFPTEAVVINSPHFLIPDCSLTRHVSSNSSVAARSKFARQAIARRIMHPAIRQNYKSSTDLAIMESIPHPPLASDEPSSESSSSESSSPDNVNKPLDRPKASRLRLLSTSATTGSPLFRSLRRNRLWTADTLPVQNTSTSTRPRPILSLARSHSSSLAFSGAETSNAAFQVPLDNPTASPYTMRSDINPFVSFDDDMNTTPLLDDDEQSTFSSVSNDSARRWSPASDQMECNTPPPNEIIIRTKSTSSDDSGSSNQTSFPVSTWQKSWVEGGAVACICGRESPPSETPYPSNHVERPSLVVSTSRSHSFGTSTIGAEEAQYRLQAPRHQCSSNEKNARLDERNRPQQDAAMNAVIDSMEDMSLSPKSPLHRVTTDTTTPTSCSTVHQTPILRNDDEGLPTTRDPFVFRPLMRRACTTNHTIASTQRLPKPRLQPRHATSSHVGTAPSGFMDATSVASSSQQQQLLGDRPRRKPVHGSESVFSFGSIVGQSSFVTPTSITNVSGTDSTAHHSHHTPPPHIPATAQEFAQMVKANKRLNQTAAMDEASIFIPPLSQRRKSALHQDWEYLCQSVRRWTGTAERLTLQRNHDGCLT
jgi:hypothetical protein